MRSLGGFDTENKKKDVILLSGEWIHLPTSTYSTVILTQIFITSLKSKNLNEGQTSTERGWHQVIPIGTIETGNKYDKYYIF